MNSDRATFGDSTWSTQTVNDSMYACSVGECSNSSEIRETTGGRVNLPVSLLRDRGDQRVQQGYQNSSDHQGQRNFLLTAKFMCFEANRKGMLTDVTQW